MVHRLFIQLDIFLRRFREILHDPERYPDPEEFKPQRFLNEDGSVRDDPTLALAFGAGTRICPGHHIVNATLFIVASSVLSSFNVTKAKEREWQRNTSQARSDSFEWDRRVSFGSVRVLINASRS